MSLSDFCLGTANTFQADVLLVWNKMWQTTKGFIMGENEVVPKKSSYSLTECIEQPVYFRVTKGSVVKVIHIDVL